MPSTQRVPAVNRLLEALPSSDLRRLLAACETVELAFAAELYTSGARLSHVYFPISSFISLIMPIDDSSSLEVGLVGKEGARFQPTARRRAAARSAVTTLPVECAGRLRFD